MWKTYFSDPTERKTDDIEANKSNLRFTLSALQTSLYNIFNSIVRASPQAREGILSFFALVVSLNSRRAGMRVDPSSVSSDGYMTNLQVVLLKLFEPVMDASYSKVGEHPSNKEIDMLTNFRLTKLTQTTTTANELILTTKPGSTQPRIKSTRISLRQRHPISSQTFSSSSIHSNISV